MTIAAAEAFLNRKLNAQYPPKKMEFVARHGLFSEFPLLTKAR